VIQSLKARPGVGRKLASRDAPDRHAGPGSQLRKLRAFRVLPTYVENNEHFFCSSGNRCSRGNTRIIWSCRNCYDRTAAAREPRRHQHHGCCRTKGRMNQRGELRANAFRRACWLNNHDDVAGIRRR